MYSKTKYENKKRNKTIEETKTKVKNVFLLIQKHKKTKL